MELGYALAGLLVGFIVGLTGVGGGSLMTPILIMVLGVALAVAVGTDLLRASLTGGAGVRVHARRGNAEWKLAGRLAAGSLAAAALALLVLHVIGVDSYRVGGVITAAPGVALILTPLALLSMERLHKAGTIGGVTRERMPSVPSSRPALVGGKMVS